MGTTRNTSGLLELALDDVEQEVVDSLRELHEAVINSWSDARCTRKGYTRAVKKAIGGIGLEHGYTVCSSEDDYCEWLWDLCWRVGENDSVLNLPLVMECEWHRDYDELLDDFQKLLVVRADHRIFLCEQKPKHWNDCVMKFIEQIRRYGGTEIGDRYLFGSWAEDGWDFRQHIVEPGTPSQ